MIFITHTHRKGLSRSGYFRYRGPTGQKLMTFVLFYIRSRNFYKYRRKSQKAERVMIRSRNISIRSRVRTVGNRETRVRWVSSYFLCVAHLTSISHGEWTCFLNLKAMTKFSQFYLGASERAHELAYMELLFCADFTLRRFTYPFRSFFLSLSHSIDKRSKIVDRGSRSLRI